MAALLEQQERIWFPPRGEDPLFGRKDMYSRLEEELDARYGDAPRDKLWGGKYVHAMAKPEVLARMHAHNPEMKLLLILRDPVQRAWSSYWFARAHGWETLDFEQAWEAEQTGSRTGYIAGTELRHLGNGLYATHVEACRNVFGNRCLVVLLDDLRNEQAATLGAVLEHIGLSAAEASPVGGDVRKNEAFEPHVRWLHSLVNKEDALHKQIARRLLPPKARYWFDERVTKPLLAFNTRRRKTPEMPAETRMRLEAFYRDEMLRLQELLGRELPWLWLRR